MHERFMSSLLMYIRIKVWVNTRRELRCGESSDLLITCVNHYDTCGYGASLGRVLTQKNWPFHNVYNLSLHHFLRQIEFPTSCYEIILHEYLESSYLVNQFFDVIFYVQPPRHFCTLGTPREYTLNIGFTYWDIPKIFKVYEKSRCARDKYKAEVFRTQEHLFGAWQCKQTIFFNSFSKKRVAVCKDAMVKSLNNVLYVSFVFSTGKSVWHNVTFLSVWPVIHQIIKCDFVMLYEVPVCHFYVCCTVHIKK